MKTSLNQLNRELKEIAQAHDQINSYHWGDLSDAMAKPIIYPLMNCYVQSGGGFQNNATDIPLVVEIYDLVYKDSSNLNEVESDTKQLLRDVFQVINKSTRWKKIGKVNTVTDAKYKWTGADDVAGWAQSISFKLRDVSGVCSLPMDGYDFEQSSNNTSSCNDGEVTINTQFLINAPSGGTVDVELVDQNGSTITPTSIVGGVIEIDLSALCTGTASITSTGKFDDPYGDFFTLPTGKLNYWGHNFRLVGMTGGYATNTGYYTVGGVLTTKVAAFPDGLICDLRHVDCAGNFPQYQDNLTLTGSTSQADAISFCNSFSLAGFSDWRLWTRNEANSLFYGPSTTYGLFTRPWENASVAHLLWTNTDYMYFGNDTRAWYFSLENQVLNFTNKTDPVARPFPVRTGNISEF